MKTNIFKTLFLLSTLVSSHAYSQLTETYYSSTEGKEGGTVTPFLKTADHHVIIGGRSISPKGYTSPAIMKIDTLGNKVWNTASFETGTSNNSATIFKLLSSGGYIYAIRVMNEYPDYSKELWKINEADGAVIWKKAVLAETTQYPNHLIDYDSTTLLVSYAGTYNFTDSEIKAVFLSKITGDTVLTRQLATSNWPLNEHGLAVDRDKNLYVTKLDTIFKLDTAFSVIWGVRHASVNALSFEKIYLDENDSIFMFGRSNTSTIVGKVVAIGKKTGNLRWGATASTSDVRFNAMIDKGGHLYVTWQHAYVGSASQACWTTGINKLSGNVEWNSYYNFTGVGTGSASSHSGGGESAVAMDIDDNGDLYLTGYYGDANYGPENWGILKLAGTTGSTLYERTITEDSVNYNDLSSGWAVCVFNNKPYFIGDLETYHKEYERRSKITFVKLDGASGNVLIKKYIEGEHQYRSEVIGIEKYGKDRTITLIQDGRFTTINMYDSLNQVLWSHRFEKEYYLYGSNLSVDNDSIIVFSARGEQYNSASGTDSIYVFYLDASGNIFIELAFSSAGNSAPVEMVHDSFHQTFLFYNKNSVLYCRKITAGVLSAEYNLNITYDPLSNQSRYTINRPGNMLIFGIKTGLSKVIALDKNLLTTTDLATLPGIQAINDVLDKGGDTVFICGRNGTGDRLMKYNTALLNTVWSQTYSAQGEMLKCRFNEDSTALYSIGRSLPNLVVRKIATANGTASWSHLNSPPSGLYNIPRDLIFDTYRKHLVVMGYQSTVSGSVNHKNVFIKRFNPLGNSIDSFLRTGIFNGDHSGMCSEVLPGKNIWIGGAIRDSLHGKAGFIYELASPVYCPVILNNTSCGSYTSPSGNYTWTVSGIYKDTVSDSSSACLNVIYTINLVVQNSRDSVIHPVACNSYTSPGGHVWTASGVYQDTLRYTTGCDSIIYTVHLEVYNRKDSVISAAACGSYTSPLGHVWTTSGTHRDTLRYTAGCDSIIYTVHLTVDSRTDSTIYPVICGSYYITPGGQFLGTNGTYQDTLRYTSGCDSIIYTIHLDLDTTSNYEIFPVVCNSYNSPGGHVWTTSGTYQDTLRYPTGCDSIVYTIHLEVYNSKDSTIYPVVCNSYTSPGGHVWTTSGVYQDTLRYMMGCDSIIFTVYLTVNTSKDSNLYEFVCSSYTSPGGHVWTATGVYKDTLRYTMGCDSIIFTVHLVVNDTMFSISDSACSSYTSPSGKYVWTTSGIYQDTLLSPGGCKIIISIDLTIHTVDTSVTQSGDSLFANAAAASFQWLDCGNNYAAITGDTNAAFTSATSGNFAVRVSQNGCVDTSSCYTILHTGLVENDFGPGLTVYPNPTSGFLTIDLGQNYGDITAVVRDLKGQVVTTSETKQGRVLNLEISGPEGYYLIDIADGNGKRAVLKVLKR
jgi:peptide methionine sulfoxide reductase MsrB